MTLVQLIAIKYFNRALIYIYIYIYISIDLGCIRHNPERAKKKLYDPIWIGPVYGKSGIYFAVSSRRSQVLLVKLPPQSLADIISFWFSTVLEI